METKKLIDELLSCAAVCESCFDALLMEKNRDEFHSCILLAEDCADICRLTAQLIDRGSERAGKFLKLCSEICADCEGECRKHTLHHCRLCAEACRLCSELCYVHEYHLAA